MEVLNELGESVNVLHFHGNSRKLHRDFLEEAFNKLNPTDENVSIISCWTDDEKCLLYKQCLKFNIPLINAYEKTDKKWEMKDKISYYLKALEQSDAEIVLLLDGYDSLIVDLKTIIDRFKSTGKRIFFNASRYNYPDVILEEVPNRDLRGEARYFNAGACIGYREDLIKFYKKCQHWADRFPNPLESEQIILRWVFEQYYLRKTMLNEVDYDSANLIFQTFGKTNVVEISPEVFLVFSLKNDEILNSNQ